MHQIAGYKILETVSECESSHLFRAQRDSDRRYVLIKRATSKLPKAQVMERLKWERQVIDLLKLTGVPAVEELRVVSGHPLLVLEHFDGFAWNRFERNSLNLETFFSFAIAIAHLIGDIHAKALVHKSINPANILISPGSGEVRLVGFGFATRLTKEFSDYLEINMQVEDFGYIAPEQTGRMNCDVDYRVDWYALGASFYRILSGYRPFPSKDPLDAVYAHLARHPRSLHLLEPKVPEQLSNLVAKLMAKQPEERYQSKHGLIADLKMCQQQYLKSGQIASFDLGSRDVSSVFNIPRKLYGRKPEIDRLLALFDNISQGGKALCLLNGPAGSGKTSLVWEVHRPIASKHGFFLSGKFDQYNRRMPYSAFLQAFRGMVRQIMTTGKERVAFWRKEILETTGTNGKLLVDVIPELSLLIGERPEVPALPPAESQNRFTSVFGNFIRLFARREHPLLLFLDDLQWADGPSLKLLESIMHDPDLNHLMMVASYRERELAPGNALQVTLSNLHKAELNLEDIKLDTFEGHIVAEILADTLATTIHEVADLAQACHQKTHGNPFFLRQFLQAIHERKLIFFDVDAGRWKWSIKEISQAQITENVAELLSTQMKSLPYQTFSLLKLAACIGAQFDLATLALVSGTKLLETREALWPALDGGLIRPRNERYKFVTNERDASLVFFSFMHDRIQQAAYALIAPERLARTHLEIGRALLNKLNTDDRDKRLFEVVNHLLHGIPHLSEAKERFSLANLLLRAGIRAKESSVFKLAGEYLDCALTLVNPSHWQEHHSFMRDLHLEAAETCYIHHRIEDMEQLLLEVEQRAKLPHEQRRVYEIRITGYVTTYDWKNAYRAGLDGLAAMGLRFPEAPDRNHVNLYLEEARKAIYGVGLDKILELPHMSDELTLNQIRLMSTAMTPIFHLDLNLFAMMAARFVTLSLQGGHMELSSYLYASYCIVIVNDDPERASALGLIAIKLARQFPSSKAQGRTAFTVYGNVSYRKQSLLDLVPLILEPYTSLIESGDVEFAAYALLYHLMFSFLAGAQSLADLEKSHDRWCRVLKRLVLGHHTATLYYQAILDLSGKSPATRLLQGSQYDRETMEVDLIQKQDGFSLSMLYTLELMLAYLYGRDKQAWNAVNKARDFGAGEAHEYNTSIYCTFASLALLSRCERDPSADTQALLEEVSQYQSRMAEWAKEAPANFLARWHLVEAEKARILKQTDMLMSHFDQAIALTAKGRNLWERALVNEVFGRYWLTCEARHLAGIFLRRAGANWMSWGAYGKLKALKLEFGALMDAPADEILQHEDHDWSEYDLAAVIKATQVISSEIVLGDVLEKLVRIAMENAGAQRGFLLFERGGQWVVAAQGELDEIHFLQDKQQPLEETTLLSLGVCRYVINTGEPVVLQDAASSEIWDNDPYVRQQRPKSLLCLAISHKGNTVAVLYLENNLRRGVFTDNHRRVLGMLATQAAISLENATLYADLERKVQERTVQLRFKTEQLLGSIRYAKRIQDGILQNPDDFACPELGMFVVYLPKDIVSGDLYWFNRRGDQLFAAAIDCTGHGVPGALMSMVGQILINQIFNEQQECNPALLLEELSQRIRLALAIDTPRSPEGMEVCCCCINTRTRQVLFAGAQRPLYVVRDGQVIEIRGSRRSLGDLCGNEDTRFENHVLELKSGDNLFLTTDGYADQCDDEGKRLGKNRLKKLLGEIAAYTPADQSRVLQQHLDSYCGERAQRDDITLIGISFNPASDVST